MQSYNWNNYIIEVSDAAANYIDCLGEYNAIHLLSSDPTSVVLVKLRKDHKLVKQIIFGTNGGMTSVYKSSTILDGDKLVCCCADALFCISIPDLNLIWHTKADEFTCFQVFKWKEDYIIHGEVEISKLNRSGDIVWQHSGADIFVKPKGDSFRLFEDYVEVEDWNGRLYKFDFDGNAIS